MMPPSNMAATEQGIFSSLPNQPTTQHTNALPFPWYTTSTPLHKYTSPSLSLQAPPSLLAYSSSILSSYSLFAAFSTSDAVCATPALVSAAAELPFFSLASSMAEATWLVTDSLSREVSLVEGLSELVSVGREGMVGRG